MHSLNAFQVFITSSFKNKECILQTRIVLFITHGIPKVTFFYAFSDVPLISFGFINFLANDKSRQRGFLIRMDPISIAEKIPSFFEIQTSNFLGESVRRISITKDSVVEFEDSMSVVNQAATKRFDLN